MLDWYTAASVIYRSMEKQIDRQTETDTHRDRETEMGAADPLLFSRLPRERYREIEP